MHAIDLNSLEQRQVYIYYELYQMMKEKLERKNDKTEKETADLEFLNVQLALIEAWINDKLDKSLNWTREEILLRYGHRPTLVLNFHPSSKSYKKYGKEIVANVEFSESELLEVLENIQNKTERKSGKIRFKVIPENTMGEIETMDIFEIGGR